MEQEKSKIFKEFSFKEQEYVVKTPSLNIMRESKYVYARSFTDAIKQGFLTRKKMEVTLQQAEAAVFKDYIDRRSDILKSMVETEEAMSKAENSEDLEYLAEVMSLYRNSLLQEDMNMSSLFSNTADQLAEDDKINYLISSLICKKSGEKVWSTMSDLLEETEEAFIETCKYQIMCLDYKLNPDWEKELPEVKAKVKAKEMREKKVEELALEQKKLESDKDNNKQGEGTKKRGRKKKEKVE